MKRILAGLALTTAAALAIGAPAQAAPVDPVKALKKQFVSGHGVRISETSRTVADGKTLATFKTTGRFAFGKSGVVASDIKNSLPGTKSLTPPRSITIGGHSYVQGGVFSEDLPEGKKWVRYEGPAGGSSFNQVIDVFEPKVLKAVISKAKSFKGGTYKGSLTYNELANAYGAKLDGKFGKIKVEYALSINSKGLVRELKTTWALDFGVLGKTSSTTETHYTGWGSTVTIKAPAKSQWIDVSDLDEDSEVPEKLSESSIDSFAK